jgi:hypothetical protein
MIREPDQRGPHRYGCGYLLRELTGERIRALREKRGEYHGAEQHHETAEQNKTIRAPQRAISKQQPGKRHHHEHEREFPPEGLRIHRYRYYQRAQRHHETDVGNVRTHRVTHGDARITVERRNGGDQDLRHRSPDANDGKTDDERRHAEVTRRRRSTQHESVRSPHEQGQSGDNGGNPNKHNCWRRSKTLMVSNYDGADKCRSPLGL